VSALVRPLIDRTEPPRPACAVSGDDLSGPWCVEAMVPLGAIEPRRPEDYLQAVAPADALGRLTKGIKPSAGACPASPSPRRRFFFAETPTEERTMNPDDYVTWRLFFVWLASAVGLVAWARHQWARAWRGYGVNRRSYQRTILLAVISGQIE
jgi:hypothetical protein